MADRPKHPDKDLEKVMQAVEAQGWTFAKGKKYFKGRCPCGVHAKTVHLTPSSGRYEINLKHQFTRLECWEKGVRL